MIPPGRLALLVALAMTAFAANSLLCRLALRDGAIDAATFTTIRIGSGAMVLWVIARMRDGTMTSAGSWKSAAALFAYAAAFSFAYVELAAGIGALLLFCAVQVTMIGWGLWSGERVTLPQGAGLALAIGGLVGLLWPGLSAPPPGSAALMIAAGVAWGIYSLRGKRGGDPTIATAGNFMRAVPFAVALSLATLAGAKADAAGVLYAIASGALASGVGYAIWYTALPGLTSTKAATIQLSVPVIAAAAAVVLLDEAITLRLVLGSAAILGGIALVVMARRPERAPGS
jgi:drug/metabolite transporter (DMT)-like permease